jgi:hypothetical protein
MTRPRSIPGLVFHLPALHVERRLERYAAVAALLFAGLVWSRLGGERHAARGHRDLQAAVLKDGFALTYLGDAGRRVVELDPQGQHRHEVALPQRDALRLVGTRAGSVVGWLRGEKLRLALVDDITGEDTWGKSVRQLCDGVATNSQRFGIAWLEADDTVWIVHAPLAAAASDQEVAEPIALAGLAHNDWCGVASAEHNIALMWRSGDRMSFTMCSKKACSSLPASFTLDRRIPIVGAGCLRNMCLLATRDTDGAVRLSLASTTGRTKWSRPLPTSSPVSIVGVGDRAFAVGYETMDGAVVLKLDRDGKATPVWSDRYTTAPVLAWSSGRLLIARFRGDSLEHDTVALAP